MEIRYKKLIPEAKAPLKIIEVDAGFDLYSTSIIETPDFIEYKTGLAFEIPVGYAGFLFPRSSVTKYDLILKNSIGLIDASFRGEIVCRFAKVINDVFRDADCIKEKKSFWGRLLSTKKSNFIDIWFLPRKIKKFEVGERVAQIVFIEIPKITLIEATELSETERGTGGFGHTGKF
jgi:dUTP pyrophosphatase